VEKIQVPHVAAQNEPKLRPLCVDMDGTLLCSDSLMEAICAILRRNFFDILRLPFWLSRGKTYFKARVYDRVDIDVSRLPFRLDLLESLRIEQKRGRKLVLATGAEQSFARRVADQLGIFSEVYGSDKDTNLVGAAKARRLVERFGDKGFDYVGDSRVDLAVWKHAHTAWIVSSDHSLLHAAERVIPLEKRFEKPGLRLKVLVKALRVHQWSKNFLIFLPMLLSGHYLNLWQWMHCVLAFFSYSFIASSVYILNDLLDIEADRRHPDNRKRPFAAGTMSIGKGVLLAPLLLASGLSIGAWLSAVYFWVVTGYFVMTCLYSLRLKQVVMADIIVLSILYTWRVLAGGVATSIVISEWFLTFALFFFLSLALLKRCSELILMEQNNQKKNVRRGYLVADLPLLVSVGVANGYLSVLVLALYINDPKVASHMRYPQALWILCPMLLYWISRMWLKAYRGAMPTDPLVFALRDKTSYVIAFLTGVLWLSARAFQFIAFTF
jgi:4-hydroxybenzoate polyprenyltransferase/phosphoserine phosphatase